MVVDGGGSALKGELLTSGNSVLEAGKQGIASASRGLLTAAQSIASAGTSAAEPVTESDLASAIVEQKRSAQLFNASAQVVSVGSASQGRLIDTIV